MNDKTLWKLSELTQKYITEVNKEISSTRHDLAGGILLVHNDAEKISREYAYNIGYLDGLKFLDKYFDIEESNDESEAISRENEG